MAGKVPHFIKIFKMFSGPNCSRAQQLAEYAIIIGIVVGAAIAMRVYLQRGLQARYRAGVRYLVGRLQDIESNTTVFNQYEPYYSNFDTNRIQSMSERMRFSPALGVPGESLTTKSLNAETRSRQQLLPGNYAD